MSKRSMIFAFLLASSLPIGALAQPSPTPSTPPAHESKEGMTGGKLVAIGGGAIVGAVLLEVIAVADAATIVGGVGGGFLGAWWYDRNAGERRAEIRRPTALPAAARPASLDLKF